MVPHHELEEIGSFEHLALAWELMENASTPSLAPFKPKYIIRFTTNWANFNGLMFIMIQNTPILINMN
jgi:hypothetical protein